MASADAHNLDTLLPPFNNLSWQGDDSIAINFPETDLWTEDVELKFKFCSDCLGCGQRSNHPVTRNEFNLLDEVGDPYIGPCPWDNALDPSEPTDQTSRQLPRPDWLNKAQGFCYNMNTLIYSHIPGYSNVEAGFAFDQLYTVEVEATYIGAGLEDNQIWVSIPQTGSGNPEWDPRNALGGTAIGMRNTIRIGGNNKAAAGTNKFLGDPIVKKYEFYNLIGSAPVINTDFAQNPRLFDDDVSGNDIPDTILITLDRDVYPLIITQEDNSSGEVFSATIRILTQLNHQPWSCVYFDARDHLIYKNQIGEIIDWNNYTNGQDPQISGGKCRNCLPLGGNTWGISCNDRNWVCTKGESGFVSAFDTDTCSCYLPDCPEFSEIVPDDLITKSDSKDIFTNLWQPTRGYTAALINRNQDIQPGTAFKINTNAGTTSITSSFFNSSECDFYDDSGNTSSRMSGHRFGLIDTTGQGQLIDGHGYFMEYTENGIPGQADLPITAGGLHQLLGTSIWDKLDQNLQTFTLTTDETYDIRNAFLYEWQSDAASRWLLTENQYLLTFGDQFQTPKFRADGNEDNVNEIIILPNLNKNTFTVQETCNGRVLHGSFDEDLNPVEGGISSPVAYDLLIKIDPAGKNSYRHGKEANTEEGGVAPLDDLKRFASNIVYGQVHSKVNGGLGNELTFEIEPQTNTVSWVDAATGKHETSFYMGGNFSGVPYPLRIKNRDSNLNVSYTGHMVGCRTYDAIEFLTASASDLFPDPFGDNMTFECNYSVPFDPTSNQFNWTTGAEDASPAQTADLAFLQNFGTNNNNRLPKLFSDATPANAWGNHYDKVKVFNNSLLNSLSGSINTSTLVVVNTKSVFGIGRIDDITLEYATYNTDSWTNITNAISIVNPTNGTIGVDLDGITLPTNYCLRLTTSASGSSNDQARYGQTSWW